MRLTFKIDRELLQDLMLMPESAMITKIRVINDGFIEFSVEDVSIPEVPGILETKPLIVDGVWSWNLAEALH